MGWNVVEKKEEEVGLYVTLKIISLIRRLSEIRCTITQYVYAYTVDFISTLESSS